MSILNRKRDLAYLMFFIIHVPIIFCECNQVAINEHYKYSL